MTFRFIKSPEKKEIVKELEKYYGISELPYLLMETGKEKIRVFSGSFSKEEIVQLNQITKIEVVGLYFISQKDSEPRLSFDAVSLSRKKITKNIFEMNEEQFNLWIRGHDLDVKTQRGVVVVKYKDDLICVGKSNGEKIFNYVPKERKLKTQLPKR